MKSLDGELYRWEAPQGGPEPWRAANAVQSLVTAHPLLGSLKTQFIFTSPGLTDPEIWVPPHTWLTPESSRSFPAHAASLEPVYQQQDEFTSCRITQRANSFLFLLADIPVSVLCCPSACPQGLLPAVPKVFTGGCVPPRASLALVAQPQERAWSSRLAPFICHCHLSSQPAAPGDGGTVLVWGRLL